MKKSNDVFNDVTTINKLEDTEMAQTVTTNENEVVMNSNESNKNGTAMVQPQENKEIKVDLEFYDLFRTQTTGEYEELKHSIMNDGCRDPLVVWKETGILVDGHNRRLICEELGITPPIYEKSFENREQVKMWMLCNQLGRRNLTGFNRAEMVLKVRPGFAAEAKENQRAGGGAVRQKSDKPLTTSERLALLARMSHDTLNRVQYILDNASNEVKDKLRIGEAGISINSVYEELKGKNVIPELAPEPVLESAPKPKTATGSKASRNRQSNNKTTGTPKLANNKSIMEFHGGSKDNTSVESVPAIDASATDLSSIPNGDDTPFTWEEDVKPLKTAEERISDTIVFLDDFLKSLTLEECGTFFGTIGKWYSSNRERHCALKKQMQRRNK